MKHLPECPKAIIEPTLYYCGIPLSKSDSVCICDALRSCEQRVSAKKDEIIGLTAFHSYRKGYNDALEEAEEAINKAPTTTNLMITLQDALAAIEALGGER